MNSLVSLSVIYETGFMEGCSVFCQSAFTAQFLRFEDRAELMVHFCLNHKLSFL